MMYNKDYWKIEYELDGEQNVAYAMAPYKNYDKRKIKAIYNELNPDWKKLKITKVKEPDGGSDVETRS